MAERTIKTRMVQKHDTSENWAKATNFAPLLGEIIIYDDLNKFKIGDGNTNVNDLPFASGGVGENGDGDSSIIFNSDENQALTAYSAASGYKTIAGKRAFKITEKTSTTSFTLDSVEGLAVGDTISYSVPQSGSGTTSVSWKEMQDMAKITAISGNVITLDTAIPDNLDAVDITNYQDSDNRVACRLWVNEKPQLGTHDLSTKANARGREGKALGEASDVGGKGNTVTAPYGASFNSNNKIDAESGFGFGSSNTLEQTANRSAIGGINNTGKAYASLLGGNQSKMEETARESIGWGVGLDITAPNSAVFGKYNKPNGDLLFSLGNGTGDENRHNAFEVDKDGNVNTQGDIKRVAYATIEGQTGWVKFAEYSFATYKQGGALLGIKQTYVGSKFNALVELEINTIDKDFHSNEGIVFRQLAGKDITDKLGYVVDSTTKNISFYVNKGQYEYIWFNLLSDTFGGYMKYFVNESVESSTPSFTAKLSGSVLGATKSYVDSKFSGLDLSDYYTKSEVDSKLSSVYKYKGTVQTSVLLPVSGEDGDVYNVISGSTTMKSDSAVTGGTLQSITINSDDTVSLTLSGVSFETGMVSHVGILVKIPDNYGGGTISLVGEYKSYSNKILTLKKIKCDIPSVTCFDTDFTMIKSMMGTSSFSIDTIYFAYTTSNYFNDGANVARLQGSWDELGTTVDVSAKADKSTTLSGYGIEDAYTKTEIDSKISSVYKYKGSVLNPLLLPDSDQTQGEVYNCILGGGLSKLYKQSTISVKSVSHNESKYTITVNFGSTVSSDIYDGGNTKPDTVYLKSNMASGYVYGKVTATTGTSITVDYSAYVEAMKKQNSSGIDLVYQFVNFNAGFPFDTSTFIVTKGTTSDPIQYINTGVNVAWNGSSWDSLGTTIDLSGKADKSTTLAGYGITNAYTKTEVDNKIAVSGGTSLPNTVIFEDGSTISGTYTGKNIIINGTVTFSANTSFTNCIVKGIPKSNNTTYQAMLQENAAGLTLTFKNCSFYDLRISLYGDQNYDESKNPKARVDSCFFYNCAYIMDYGITTNTINYEYIKDSTFIGCSYYCPSLMDAYFKGTIKFIGGFINLSYYQSFENANTTLILQNMNIACNVGLNNWSTGKIYMSGCYSDSISSLAIPSTMTLKPSLATMNDLNFLTITQE